MNQPEQALPGEHANSLPASLRQVADALGLDPAGWCDLLAASLIGLAAGFALKEVSTGRYIYASERMAELFGRPPEDLLGHTDADLFGAEVAALLRAAEASTVTLARPHSSDHRIERDQTRREFHVTRVLLTGRPDAAGASKRYLCALWHDVSTQRQRDAQLTLALQQLEQQQQATEALRRETQDASLRDLDTGLFPNAHFEDQLRREVDLSLREHREFSMVSISIDPPTGTAGALGATARQRVIEALGRLLRSNTRAMDASCRVSDDRFAVLLSGVGLATAHSRMEGLRRQCATQIVVLDGQDFGFTVSMGVASFPHTAHTQDDLLQAADTALMAAQSRGGNHVTLASIPFEGSF
jgi:diguanylate cyclase (GGDEF)-like protein